MTNEQILQAHEAERTKCTVYTRVMGYHRPVETFNLGKKGEFRERRHFSEPCEAKDNNIAVKEPVKNI